MAFVAHRYEEPWNDPEATTKDGDDRVEYVIWTFFHEHGGFVAGRADFLRAECSRHRRNPFSIWATCGILSPIAQSAQAFY